MKNKLLVCSIVLIAGALSTTQLSAQCVAGLTFTVNTNTVVFTNTSTGGVSGGSPYYFWKFGDGNYAYSFTTAPVQHEYVYNGTYTVCLTMIDSSNNGTGCFSNICYPVVITNAPNPPCNVHITGSNTIVVGQSAKLKAKLANPCSNATYVWSTGATIDSIIVAPSVTTTYTVIACCPSASCCDTAVVTVVVLPFQPCSASLYLKKDSINPLLWYAYPYVTGTAPITYLWSFGDGTTSTQQYPTHTYSVVGNYLICLTITDANCTATTCDSTYKVVSPNSILTLVVVDPNATGIEENTVSVNSVFPNPSSDVIEVSLSQQIQGALKITDITGREVYTENINAGNVKVNVSNLPVGFYNLSIVSGSKTFNNKVMIAR